MSTRVDAFTGFIGGDDGGDPGPSCVADGAYGDGCAEDPDCDGGDAPGPGPARTR